MSLLAPGFCKDGADLSPPENGAGLVPRAERYSPAMCSRVTPSQQQAAKPFPEMMFGSGPEGCLWEMLLDLLPGQPRGSGCSCRTPAAPEASAQSVAGRDRRKRRQDWQAGAA